MPQQGVATATAEDETGGGGGETKEMKSDTESESSIVKVEFVEDESSPRGVLEISGSSSGTDSDRSVSSRSSSGGSPSSSSFDRAPDDSSSSISGSRLPWRTMIDNLKKKGRRGFSTIPLLAASYDISRKNLRNLARIRSAEERTVNVKCDDRLDIPFSKPSWRNFDLAELTSATDDFHPENLVGKGGEAEVYRGRLSDGKLVAVKRLMKNEKEEEQRVGDFLSELGIIAHINHPNSVKLLGFGISSSFLLVLEFSSHGSLASLLFGTSDCLGWKIRFKVAQGVAEGLKYLHHECHRRIIHRDIKASNILLTEDYEAQISDYGLAKWLPDKWAHHVVFPIEGTFGYLAPEYFMHGIINEKTDVFAYGVLLLELITGRRAVDWSQQSLVIWAKPLLENNNVKELVDPKLGDTYNPSEMKHAMSAALMCIHHSASTRPYMTRVMQVLKGEDNQKDQLKQSSMKEASLLLEACDLEDYTCSSYLSDLNRHRELVME